MTILQQLSQVLADLWDTAEVGVRHQILPSHLFENVEQLLGVLEVPDEGGVVVETPERDLVAPGVLGPDPFALVVHDYLEHDPDALLAQDLGCIQGGK